MKDDTQQRLAVAARQFDATPASDTTPLGRWKRAEARLELFRALVADGWDADLESTRQAELDELTVTRTAPAGTPTKVSVLRVA